MDKYKQITDEFFAFYKSFIESGFTEEQAFEMVKAYSNSHVVSDFICQLDRVNNTRHNFANKLRKQAKRSENSLQE